MVERREVIPLPLGVLRHLGCSGGAYSLGMTLLFLLTCLGLIWWIFRSGYRIKQ